MWEVFWGAIAGSGVATGLVSWYFSRKTEEYKSALERTNKQVQALLDKSLFVSKIQIEHKYELYKTLWNRLSGFNMAMLALNAEIEIPGDTDNTEKLDRFNKMNDSFVSFFRFVENNRPFFEETDYTILMQLASEMEDNAHRLHGAGPNDKIAIASNKATIQQKIQETCDLIRERISKLST